MFVLDRNIYFNTDHVVTGKIVESRGMRAVSPDNSSGGETGLAGATKPLVRI
jgi:hypothetical protein